jgi:hypothetical protein
VNLQNDFLRGELEFQIASFVDYYNNHRYHESLAKLTPGDMYFGKAKDVLNKSEKIEKRTLQQRCLQNLQAAAV